MTAAHWYELGKYRILAKPLATNPAFTTHHIYLGPTFIGKQLSAPSVDDCDNRLREHNEPVPAPCSTAERFSEGRPIWNATKRGRPRKADAERELLEALDA